MLIWADRENNNGERDGNMSKDCAQLSVRVLCVRMNVHVIRFYVLYSK